MTLRGNRGRRWLLTALGLAGASLLLQADPGGLAAGSVLAVPAAGLVCLLMVRRRGETHTL